MREYLLNAGNGSFLYDPAVFMVEDKYCIVFLTSLKGIAWAEIGGAEYGAETLGGLVRSDLDAHRIFVPAEILNAAGAYTVCFAPVADRAPYFPKSGNIESLTRSFRAPGKNPTVKAYHLCDTHTHVTQPTKAAEFYGEDTDLIIMNGDIPNHSGSREMIMKVHELCQRVTHGELPIIFTRGNHDTRGAAALDFVGCTPNLGGDFFYTTRYGSIWALLLDCGEDKSDGHKEYGGMVSFEGYRRRQIDFLRRINAQADREYLAPGVKHRVAVCHIPLFSDWNLFASDIYSQWLEELNKMGLEIMLCGHNHTTQFFPDGADCGFGRMDFPVVIGGTLTDGGYTGTALEFTDSGIDFAFTDSEKRVLEKYSVKLKG